MDYEEPSLKQALYDILNGLQSEKNWREVGEGVSRIRDIVPNVTESLSRGGIGQAIGTSGDLRELRNTVNSYLPKSVRNLTQAAEFLANPYATAIQQTAPTTEEVLETVPRITDKYEGYKQHETLGEYIAPSLGYFGGKAAKAYGEYVGPTAYKALEDYLVKTGGIQPITTWHGSKSSFDEFDPKKVGSSSGIDYGHGLYSAEHPEIAKGFGQNLYKLDIPDEHIPKMIDWYSNEQSPEVTKILKEAGLPYKANGEAITMAAAEKMGGSDETKSGFQKAAEYLHSLGIKGNKYENFQIKKGQGADTYNYVSYDPAEVKILEKNGQKLISDIDELGFHSPLENAILKIQQPKGTGDQFLKQLEKTPGVKTEELDVSGVKQYLLDHPTVTKQELLDHMAANRLKLENKVLGEGTGQGNTYDEYRLEGGDVYHDDDYISSLADDFRHDMKNDEVIRDQERAALLEADPDRYMDWLENPSAAERLEKDIDGSLWEQAKSRAEEMYYENPIRHYHDEHGYDIYGNDEFGYSFKDPNGRFLDIGGKGGVYDIDAAEDILRSHLLDEGILNIDEEGAAKYADYVLPGHHENYREVLTTYPTKPALVKEMSNNQGWMAQGSEGSEPIYGKTREEAISRWQDSRHANNYQSGHFDESNILAHMRVNDRTINGKKTLMVEEIQSDWHQAGRKKGYKVPDYEGKVAELKKDLGYVQDKKRALIKEKEGNIDDKPLYEQLQKQINDLEKEADAIRNKWRDLGDVPDAPYKKNWHELMVKQALDMAAKGDYDAIAFTTGKQQADRYSLSKQIDTLELLPSLSSDDVKPLRLKAYKGNNQVIARDIDESELPDLIGKEAAKKLLEQPEGKYRDRVLSGVDLDVGGEGMKGFYDKILPDFVNKYTKKWGMGTKKAKLDPDALRADLSDEELAIGLEKIGMNSKKYYQLPISERSNIYQKISQEFYPREKDQVHFVELSDLAKKDIKEKGQPLFSGIGLAAPALMPEDQDKTKK